MTTYWPAHQLLVAGGAVDAARGGTPTVLTVVGDPGSGKSTFLEEVLARADGFEVLYGSGSEAVEVPFGVLGQWGVDLAPTSEGVRHTAMLAAQRLRALLDESARRAPVLLCLDDLHWADHESVDALVRVLGRLSGDRLLALVTSRPVASGSRLEWAQWSDDEVATLRVDLQGLGRGDAVALVAERRPELPESAALRLWQHTNGNPLYLTSLLTEHDAATLTRASALPAPADFARGVGTRLGRLDASSQRLARALAVLSANRTSVRLAAAVAGDLDEAATETAVQQLRGAGLLSGEPGETGPEIGLTHALVQAAVYQQTPVHERRELHLRAARQLLDTATVLRHRFAAAAQYDDELAADLERAAGTEYDQQSYRLAAQHLRWSSTVSSLREARHRRWIESLFVSVIARDLAVVTSEHAEVEQSSDPLGRALVLGALAVVQRRWLDALRVLTPASGRLGPDTDPVLAYRIEAMLAWVRVGTGQPTEQVREGLQRLARLGVRDQAVGAYADLAAGQVPDRLDDMVTTLHGLSDLATDPREIPVHATFALAFRGAVQLQSGLVTAALADLREAQQRVESGMVDATDGGLHGYLAYACWFHGQWDLAALYFRLAEQFAEDSVLPIVQAWIPVARCGTGELAEADRLLDRCAEVLEQLPWREAVHAWVVARVVRLHAEGEPRDRESLWWQVRQRFPRTSMTEGPLGPLSLVHFALATVWAGREQEAEDFLEQIEGSTLQGAWVPAALAWVRGLMAEGRGDLDGAIRQFSSATSFPGDDLPLYRAHVLADHARLCARSGRTADANRSRDEALATYQRLGAAPYVRRLQADRSDQSDRVSAGSGLRLDISDRERDVLTLVLDGLSYAQIARDLLITQSTVSFHLGRLYAKADVGSRHELAAYARREPAVFGLTSA